MKVTPTSLRGVLLVEPRVFDDPRGRFLESWNARRYAENGICGPFVQDNVSISRRGVLRGLHLQRPPHAQGKLVSVLQGEIWDVGVDLRSESPSFGRWEGFTLDDENVRQLYLPPGFAHGFVVLSETAVVSYKCTQYYSPATEETLRWDDPDLAIPWPIAAPLLSAKDRAGTSWRMLREGSLGWQPGTLAREPCEPASADQGDDDARRGEQEADHERAVP